jgi:hypothetical protein
MPSFDAVVPLVAEVGKEAGREAEEGKRTKVKIDTEWDVMVVAEHLQKGRDTNRTQALVKKHTKTLILMVTSRLLW